MLCDELQNFVEGDVVTDTITLTEYSRDTSLFSVRPEVVVFPKHTEDVMEIVKFAKENKKKYPKLSITSRSAGSDMTGGPLNESVILGFTKYFTHFSVDEEGLVATVEPGVYYRNFEKKTEPENIYMPVYPASKDIAAFGGMIMNNCGGEKSLQFGQMRNFVEELSMVLSDGNAYTFKALNTTELEEKKKLDSFEGEIYRKTHELLEKNFDVIQSAKPGVSKNSAGYALWNVWNRKRFDLTQLFVGSQGTLGVMTNAKIRLVKDKSHKKLIVLFFRDWDILPEVVNVVLPVGPESLEAFDDETLKLGIRFMPDIAKKAGQGLFRFASQFMPEALIGLRIGGLPKLIVLVQLVEATLGDLDKKVHEIHKAIAPFDVIAREMRDDKEAQKYWVMRHESFNLLRMSVRGKKTAPFIEDFCVDPNDIPVFLPKLLSILKEYDIKANIAGHAGNGNFHIIPLMDLSDPKERQKIPMVADRVYDLVISHKGSITAEHNDGIIRSPYLAKMYGDKVYNLFCEIKHIFDPQNIFNPGKKVGGSVEYMKSHISSS